MSGYLTITTAGLPATIAKALEFTTRSVYGTDGQFDGAIVDTAALTGEHDEATLRRALEICRDQCRPGGARVAGEELALLERKTVGAKQGEADQKLRGAAYADELAAYPADVIRAACRRWADGNRWWPAWADLKRECDRLAAKRIAEHRALEQALHRLTAPAHPQLEAPKPLPTQVERLRTSVVLRRQAGDHLTAARHEVKLAEVEKRQPEQWARDAIAKQLADQRARVAEYQLLAEETASKSLAADETKARLAELAKKRRDAILGKDAAA